MRRRWATALQARVTGYLVAVVGVAVVVAVLAPLHQQVRTTAALALLLVVLFIATAWGSLPALTAALLGTLGYNFFFLPPVRTFTIAESQNWAAFVAFAVTALTVGQLSARVRRRAADAERARAESERLYGELQLAFERASEAEALRKSEQLKTALLDAVTHDLRSPLTSIKVSVTALLGAYNVPGGAIHLDPEAHGELLEVINEETDRLDRFVENLVDMARIEAGELAPRRSWGAVDDIITMALQRASRITALHEIRVALEDNLPPVEVDPRGLAQVIYSLLENAANYSPAHTPIQIRAGRFAEGMIRCSVEDRGPGIAPELRERVFQRFFRADQALRAKGEGSRGLGMGLAIARGIVQAHGGTIWIEDGESGHGAKVAFTVPIRVGVGANAVSPGQVS